MANIGEQLKEILIVFKKNNYILWGKSEKGAQKKSNTFHSEAKEKKNSMFNWEIQRRKYQKK